MARYLVTDGSHFTPLTYEEMVAPIKVADAAHAVVQDAYDKMSMDTQALRDYISDSDNDRDALDRYNTYMSRLEAVQNNLYQRGISAQTRKELAAARNSFAADILPVQRSIETRQSDSADMWKSVHDNPDMIHGIDPMTIGLNEYLKNINVGKQWFSYSGKQFASEIGAAAKARAQEFRRNVHNVKEVPGYITRIAQGGATNVEVDQAIEAARNNTWQNLPDGPVKFLAETVAGSIKGTGAVRGANISDKQYDRFFDYARLGLTQSIQEPDVKDFNDYKWIEENTKKGGKKEEQPPSYTLDPISTFYEAEDAKKNNETIATNWFGKFDKPIVYKSNDGSTGVINSRQDAEDILSSFGYYDIINKYGVDDPDVLPVNKQWTLPDGRKAKIQYSGEFSPGSSGLVPVIAVRNNKGEWEVDNELSEEFNTDVNNYRTAYSTFLQNNNGKQDEEYRLDELNKLGRQDIITGWGIDPDNIEYDKPWTLPSGQEVRFHVDKGERNGSLWRSRENVLQRKENGSWVTDDVMTNVFREKLADYHRKRNEFDKNNATLPLKPKVDNLKDLALKDESREKIRKENGITPDIPVDLYPYIINIKSKKGQFTPAQYASPTSYGDHARNNLKRNIMVAFAMGANSKGEVPAGSQYVIHPVDGWNIEETGKTKLEDVFGNDKSKVIDHVVEFPEDVLAGYVRIMVDHKNYAVRPFMLGDGVAKVIYNLTQPYYRQEVGKDGKSHNVLMDNAGVISFMMKPLLDPVAALHMTQKEQEHWLNCLRECGFDSHYIGRDPATGKPTSVTRPIDIILSTDLQNTLRTDVTNFIQALIADPISTMETEGQQHIGETYSKAAGYNDYIDLLNSQQ